MHELLFIYDAALARAFEKGCLFLVSSLSESGGLKQPARNKRLYLTRLFNGGQTWHPCCVALRVVSKGFDFVPTVR